MIVSPAAAAPLCASGNVSRWQCSLPCPASRAACRAPHPTVEPVWTLPADRRFEVDMHSMLAPAHRSASKPTPQADEQSAAGPSARAEGAAEGAAEGWAEGVASGGGDAPQSNFERCPLLRPSGAALHIDV